MLRYLVDPIFQVINTAGKPATGGYIEVYLHGTRDKYYCSSDFNGTLHPFKIPLDSLGANIILADDANAYDIYVYNRYGSLLMSRYNVAPVQGGGSEGGDAIGKVHFLKAVYDSLVAERAPYGYWIVDLEKPNPQSPYGYDYAMADEIIAKLSAGEIFVLSTYPTAPSPEEDLYIMCRSALQSREGHTAVRIWFTRMFAADSPEYMYFTTIYTPSMYNNNPMAGGYPEGRMAILNWRGQQDSRSEFHFMPYTELSEVATTGNYNDLRNRPTIPDAQVQSDWSQSDNTQVDYIKNKPILATVATSGSYDDLTNKPSIPAAQEQSDWEQSNSSAVDYIKNKPNLSTVATSGSYNDLNNKPTIPAAPVQSNWDEADSSSLAYIQNKPDLALKENVSNKVQTINDTSTTDYPSSKAVADFVNSSVATNTANFLGTLSESSLGLDYTATNAQIALALNVHSWDSPPTNNDYCFVSVNDPQTTDVDEYRRFKFNGSVWAYEYTLNNSSFTQAQWNAINSGIDSSDKAAYDAAITLLSNHVNDHSNPHNVTAAQIGAEPAFTVLPINKGGTGKTTALDAAENLINNLRAGNAQILNDNCVIITSSLNEESPLRFFKQRVVTIWNYIKDKLVGATVNVHQSDSNTDTSSFVFVNGHVYHLTVSLIGSGFSINTTGSGTGYILAYIGSSAVANSYACRQNVNIQNGVITTDDIRLHIDWKAENISSSSYNKLHIVVRFNTNWYSLALNNYELTIDGTDFSGVL